MPAKISSPARLSLRSALVWGAAWRIGGVPFKRCGR
nr:MAG TPA: hypothetical protein [Caudoviricetes sp.]